MTGIHRPMLIHFGDRHSVPAEVCDTCSDEETGVWVPVTFCDKATARMTNDPASGYAQPGGVIRRDEP